MQYQAISLVNSSFPPAIGIFLQNIFAVFPIYERHFRGTTCFGNGSFATALLLYEMLVTRHIVSSQVCLSPTCMSPL